MSEIIVMGVLTLYSIWVTSRWLTARSQLAKSRVDNARETALALAEVHKRLIAAEQRRDLLQDNCKSTSELLDIARKQSAQLAKNKAFREACAKIAQFEAFYLG